MILMLDNYDSFTYNLVQYFLELKIDVKTLRNDMIDIKGIWELLPDYIVISPGPKTPDEAGISKELIREFNGKIPILGICLGHQSIAAAYGSSIVRADKLMHGKLSEIENDGHAIFENLPRRFNVTRYHSLVIDEATLDKKRFDITARTKEGTIMAIRDKNMLTEGLQFHPESIITEHGKAMLANFLKLKRKVSLR